MLRQVLTILIKNYIHQHRNLSFNNVYLTNYITFVLKFGLFIFLQYRLLMRFKIIKFYCSIPNDNLSRKCIHWNHVQECGIKTKQK